MFAKVTDSRVPRGMKNLSCFCAQVGGSVAGIGAPASFLIGRVRESSSSGSRHPGIMNLFNPAEDENVSMVHPEYFIISGLSGIPHIKLYYVFLSAVYVLSVLANSAVMAVICLDRRLRTPKYVAVFNLAFVDLFGSSALVPKLLDVFLLGHRRIPFRSCLTFLFFCYTCLSMQPFNLVALAYDRLLAIIFPLHYQVRSRETRARYFPRDPGTWPDGEPVTPVLP